MICGKIAYINCHGLTVKKLTMVEELITLNTYDIIIISEHWFIKETNLQNSTYFLISTQNTQNRKYGHQNGGLAIFCSLKTQQSIQILAINEYSIHFKYLEKKITAVYLPPSLDNNMISISLNRFADSTNIVLGDFNCRLGKSNNDNTTTNLNRFNHIQKVFHKLFRQRNNSQSCSRNDHVLSDRAIYWKYEHQFQELFSSDHGLMSVILEHKNNENSFEETLNCQRYDLEPLNHEIIKQSLCAHYDTNAADQVDNLLATVSKNYMATLDYEQKEFILDQSFDCFMDILENVIKSHLILYTNENSTYQSKKNPQFNLSNQQVVIDFKKFQRKNNPAKLIESRNASISPLEDGKNFFTELYTSKKPHDKPQFSNDNDLQVEFITQEAFLKIINAYSSVKTGGPDALHIRIIKTLLKSEYFGSQLYRLNLIFFQNGITPTAWNTSNIHLIAKTKESKSVNSFRPVALTPILRRVFEIAVLKTQKILNHPSFDIQENQSGFRNGHSSTLQAIRSDVLSKTGSNISIFLDLQNAYDKVEFGHMLSILEQRQIPSMLRKIFYSLMFKHPTSFVMINGKRNISPIKRQCGLFQGSVLSPMLFNLFIDTLATRIPQMLLYADDVVLKCQSASEAQELLIICEKWALTYDMKWNIAKCGVVGTGYPLILNNQQLPALNSYKYLGFQHEANGINIEASMETRITNHDNFLNFMLTQKNRWSASNKRHLYVTFIEPLISYGAGCFAFWLTRQIKQTKRRWEKRITQSETKMIEFMGGSPQKKTIWLSMMALPDYNQKLDLWKASLVKHVESSHMGNMTTNYPYGTLINRDFFAHLITKSSLRNEYQLVYDSLPNDQKITWKTFARGKTIDSHLFKTGILQHYIRQRSRQPKTGIDKALKQDSFENEKMAIAWRTNTLFLNKKCVCKGNYSRRHVDTCLARLLLDPADSFLWRKYQQSNDRNHIQNEIAYKNCSSNYNLLDFALNDDPTSFFDLILKLNNILD